MKAPVARGLLPKATCAWLPVLALALAASCVSAEKSEQSAWESAPRTIDGYESYLKVHPSGRHAAEARSLLSNLRLAKAHQTDTIEAYEEFLSAHADSPFAEQARVRIARERAALDAALKATTDTLLEAFVTGYPHSPRFAEMRTRLRRMQQAPALGEVAGVDVAIDESYRDAAGVKVGLEDMAAGWAAAAGFGGVSPAAAPRATLTITLSGRPSGLLYYRIGGTGPAKAPPGPDTTMHYSGAAAKGTVTLRSGTAQITESFNSEIAPIKTFDPRKVTSSARDAPFKQLVSLPGGVAHKVALVMTRAFGRGVALQATRADHPPLVRLGAARALGDVGGGADILVALLKTAEPALAAAAAESLGRTKAASAIDPLIAALDSPGREPRSAALISLKAITKKDLGSDAAKWKEWRQASRQ